jgi:hypothetical protein
MFKIISGNVKHLVNYYAYEAETTQILARSQGVTALSLLDDRLNLK